MNRESVFTRVFALILIIVLVHITYNQHCTGTMVNGFMYSVMGLLLLVGMIGLILLFSLLPDICAGVFYLFHYLYWRNK